MIGSKALPSALFQCRQLRRTGAVVSRMSSEDTNLVRGNLSSEDTNLIRSEDTNLSGNNNDGGIISKSSCSSGSTSLNTASDSPAQVRLGQNSCHGTLTTRGHKRSTISAKESEMLQKVKAIVPKLTNSMRKGECGRIAVFGGCVLYTGAPYFAAISALKCGADLVHVFCEKGAGSVIKGYSPELIVHPVLDTEYGIEEIDQWLPRLHVVVLGPGLGRNQSMLGRISIIMEKARARNIPIVVDADGLWHLATNPALLQGYPRAVITPNAMEFSRLVKAVLHKDVAPCVNPDPRLVEDLAQRMGNITVLHKGCPDLISNGKVTEECSAGGSPRRCGGQGDVLSGTLATFLHWATMAGDSCPPPGPEILAAWGSARLTRSCAEQAFTNTGRSTTTTDMIGVLHMEFSRLYESETFL